jgi:hypothetical protein
LVVKNALLTSSEVELMETYLYTPYF